MIELCLYYQNCDHDMKKYKKILMRIESYYFIYEFSQRDYEEFIHGDIIERDCENGLRDLMKGIC